ncbi:MAG: hypothetical protein M1825_001182 [Sarcosagium campestre]|nr:MAG: hypothetical protein M1825_001182 [Sarcosagium campestre]
MRLTAASALLSFSLLCSAPVYAAEEQPQNPLGRFFNKISDFVPSKAAAAADAGLGKLKGGFSTSTAAATAVASQRIVPLHLDSWRAALTPDTTAVKTEKRDEWYVLVTGANKTCGGECVRMEKAWNESAVIFAALPLTPRQALLDCDKEPVLCTSWAAAPRTLLHFLIPRVADSPTDLRVLPINATSVTSSDFVTIHTSKSWKDVEPYTGVFHPYDGSFAKYGLSLPVGYILWGVSLVPSWAFMIVLSFVSRNFMSRRAAGARQAPQGAAPAPAPAT